LTAKGRNFTEIDAGDVVRQVRLNVQSAQLKQPPAASVSETDGVSADEIEPTWKERLLGVLKGIPADSFERLCQRILRESGFTKVEVTGRSGDGGIDGAGVLRMNLVSFHVLFQCIRWKDAVSAPVICDFREL
jgi:restriction system protein